MNNVPQLIAHGLNAKFNVYFFFFKRKWVKNSANYEFYNWSYCANLNLFQSLSLARDKHQCDYFTGRKWIKGKKKHEPDTLAYIHPFRNDCREIIGVNTSDRGDRNILCIITPIRKPTNKERVKKGEPLYFAAATELHFERKEVHHRIRPIIEQTIQASKDKKHAWLIPGSISYRTLACMPAGWRLLNPGEVIRLGDYCFSENSISDGGYWRKIEGGRSTETPGYIISKTMHIQKGISLYGKKINRSVCFSSYPYVITKCSNPAPQRKRVHTTVVIHSDITF